jgi:uncharacterized membrane protein (UPF0127 family)
MTRRILNSFVALAIVIVLAGVSYTQLANRDQGLQATSETETVSTLPITTVTLGGQSFTVELATTPAEQSLGLGGRSTMAADRGMLFLFDELDVPSFWMKDMQFALDFVWIADGRVVDITRAAAAPQPNMADSELEIYRPNGPIDSVLELNAGAAKNIVVGDTAVRTRLRTN